LEAYCLRKDYPGHRQIDRRRIKVVFGKIDFLTRFLAYFANAEAEVSAFFVPAEWHCQLFTRFALPSASVLQLRLFLIAAE
jgi:hypothetical protein